jgi:hypothetical protein
VSESPLVVSEEAVLDIDETRHRYRSIGPELEKSFRTALDDAVMAIRSRPYAYQVVHGSLRRILLRKFPYFLLFAVFDETVILFGCFHTRRDPKDWRLRG